jgi:DNA polymerase-1
MNLKEFIFEHFKNVVVYDFEFRQLPGENPEPVCCTFKELKSGKQLTHWYLSESHDWPFDNKDTLYICHSAVAEVSCMLELGQSVPNYVWDTLVQDMKLSRGKENRFNLLACCNRFGIKTISESQKNVYRNLIINNYPNYTEQEKQKIIEYNISDVIENEELFLMQVAEFEKRNKNFKKTLSQAIFHGKSQAIVAKIERNGVPVNYELYSDMEKYFPQIKAQEIEEIKKAADIYVGDKWNQKKFTEFLKKLGILKDWPRTITGQPAKDDRTLYRYSSQYPVIQQIRESKFIIEAKNLKGYVIGKDKRSRTALKMFGTITGRTNPSTATNPFGAPRRMRNIIGTTKDKILVYADWKSQEAVIQGALSKDQNIVAAVATGDPYLATAKNAKAVPQDAVRKDFERERKLYKETYLAIGYGQTAYGLKAKLNITESAATFLLANLKRIYPTYFEWIDGVIDASVARGYFETKFGWRYYIPDKESVNPRRLMNWPLQGHGSEILRRAIIDLDAVGFEISMPVHDAVLIHMDRKGCAEKIRKLKTIMSEAANKVIGCQIQVDTQIIRSQFFQEKEHQERWQKLYEKLLTAKEAY